LVGAGSEIKAKGGDSFFFLLSTSTQCRKWQEQLAYA
jgi:hypothetical protein